MPNLPSGLSVAEAEKLSREQQQQILKGLPQEGGFFLTEAGEGAKKLYQMRGGEMVGLGFNYPKDWGGRTIGQFQSEQTQTGLSALGLSDVPVINRADLDALVGQGKIKFGQEFTDIGQFAASTKGYQPTATNILPVATPDGRIAPETSLAGIRSVFGADWQPAPAFTPEMQARGIYGAVRVAGSPNVFTLGPGGGMETAESFASKFGTSEQKGIVGEITARQAAQLGISQQAISAPPIAAGGAITSNDLRDITQIDLSSLTQQQTTSLLSSTTEAGLNKYIELQKAGKSEKEKQLETKEDVLSAEIEALIGKTTGRGAAQLAAEEEAGIRAKQEAIDDANTELELKMAEIKGLETQYNLENQAIEGKTIALGRMQGQQAQNYKMFLAQKNVLLSEAGFLQAKALGLQGKLDSAQRAADRAIDLKYADIKAELDTRLAMFNLVKDELSEEQEIRANAIEMYLQDRRMAVEKAEQEEKDQKKFILDQMAKYPDAGISLTDTIEEANAKVGGSAIYQEQVRPPGYVKEPIDISDLPIDQTKENQTIIDAFNFALGSIPGTRQKQYANTFNNYMQNGDTEMAKDIILKVAYDAMPVSQREQIMTREGLLNSLNEISGDLDSLKASGIDTGFLTGTEEKIKEKIGRTKDPQVQYLQIKILNNVIAFRRAATGVQFNIIEQQQYEQIFPSIDTVDNVNRANIAALTDTIINQQETYYKQQLGASNYESVFGGKYQRSGFMDKKNEISAEISSSTIETNYLDEYLSNLPIVETPQEVEEKKQWSGLEGLKSFFGATSSGFGDTLKQLGLLK